jgi:hypothetical protein
VGLVGFCALWEEAPTAPILSTGDTMRTQRNQSVVSVASRVPGIGLAALFFTALAVGACAGRQHALTQTERAKSAESTANIMTDEPRTDVLEFENQATVYVDVYLTWPSAARQWRLGRVPPGLHTVLRVPESARDDRTLGFVQLAVIPGSPLSGEAWRDPRVVIAIPQPMSVVVSQSWSFRQPAGAALELQGMPVWGRR